MPTAVTNQFQKRKLTGCVFKSKAVVDSDNDDKDADGSDWPRLTLSGDNNNSNKMIGSA